MLSDSSRRRFPLADRLVEVIDDKPTGETLLDEALKMMKASEQMTVGTWIDLMSGLWSVSRTIVLTDHGRGDLESHEDWVSIEASARATGKGTG